jgi:hypothetical protein
VHAKNSLQPCDSCYGHFIKDAKRGLLSLGNSKFVHVKREANVAAHTLARATCDYATGSILWHCIPSCLDGVIKKETISPPLWFAPFELNKIFSNSSKKKKKVRLWSQ